MYKYKPVYKSDVYISQSEMDRIKNTITENNMYDVLSINTLKERIVLDEMMENYVYIIRVLRTIFISMIKTKTKHMIGLDNIIVIEYNGILTVRIYVTSYTITNMYFDETDDADMYYKKIIDGIIEILKDKNIIISF